MTQRQALIGHSGYVGSTLLRQTGFSHRYRSTDIAQIRNGSFDLVVCAGAPAQKWIANRDPAGDRARIEDLISHLQAVECATFVLISTVDVFVNPVAVDEDSPVVESGLHPYGLHRRLLENAVARRFPQHLIVRLPGLVGPGLRKNAIYDLHHANNLASVDARGTFQFYPMVNLWFDLQVALAQGLQLVHLTAEPISVADVAAQGFGRPFDHVVAGASPARYDLRSRHAHRFGAGDRYQYSRRETIQAIRAYAQSEPSKASTAP